jgi:excisionase family DNA binding protein
MWKEVMLALETLTYNVSEAANVLGIGRSSAYELVRTGQLASIHIGRRLLIPKRAVRQFLGLPPEENLPGPSDSPAKSAVEEEEIVYLVTVRRVKGTGLGGDCSSSGRLPL